MALPEGLLFFSFFLSLFLSLSLSLSLSGCVLVIKKAEIRELKKPQDDSRREMCHFTTAYALNHLRM